MSMALRAIFTVQLLDRRPNPRKPRGSSSRDLEIRLSRQLCNYSFQEPPTYLQKPSPIGLLVSVARGASSSPKDWCLADLVKIGLYFFLRSCKYTKTNSHHHTTQFRLHGIQFQDGRCTIHFDAPDSRLLNALVVNLFLDTQKNSVGGESISMDNTCLQLGCPVVACARRFLHLRNNDADLNTPMCVYFEHKGEEGKYVTSNHLVALLRLWAGKIGLARLGFHPHEIGSHFLRLSGAMTLHQAGQYDSNIKVIERLISDTFLIYIQGQVSTFTKGFSVAVKQFMWFKSPYRTPQQPPSS